MLRVGLTGGIGAGKSAAAAALARCGAVVIDADRISREVLEPGTPGLAAVTDAFGPDVLDRDGALDRPRLGRVVFGDPAALATLNHIVHPLVHARTTELLAAAPADAVLVQDLPLLVESQAQARFHLVVVVRAPLETRLSRLTEIRGMPAEDARARIAVQASDADRVAAADVLLDNDGSLETLRAAVEQLWTDRLVPYARSLTAGVPAPLPTRPDPPDATWPAQFARAAARLRHWLDDQDLLVEQIGPTATPDDAGPGVIDVLELRASLPSVEALRSAADRLAGSGWVVGGPGGEPDVTAASSGEPTGPAGIVAYSADPGRPARLVLTVAPA